jgi:N-hydroxyarylamine O-acetyltransferase
LLEPIPLVEGINRPQGAWNYRLKREDDITWVLQCPECPTGPDLYAFDLTRHLPVDYEPANHYTSTHPDSRFVISVTAQRAGREVRLVLRNRELITIRAEGTTIEPVETNAHLREVLERRFAIELPEGAQFSQFT